MRAFPLLKRLIKLKLVKAKIKYNKQIFKFLFFRIKKSEKVNKFQKLLHDYMDTLTIDTEVWHYFLTNIEDAICNIPKDDLLPLIELLIFEERKKEASLLINDYIAFYGPEGLKYQLKTQQYCQENGFHPQESHTDLAFFDQLNANSVLMDCIKNKSVAIVGNGPSEVGTGNGSIIDQHDYVVRFNNYQTEGFELDYGSRADIWVCNGANEIERRTDEELEGYKLIILEPDLNRDRINTGIYDLLIDLLKNHTNKIVFVDRDSKKRLVELLGSYPSTGMTAIDLLSRYTKVSLDTIFGFSFKQKLISTGKGPDHYFEDDLPDCTRHNYYMESDYIRSTFG
ncbi:MAG: glycosyltransferase family 29 protein [Planctomycetota bacterium]|nr:glycosyltransferase family 29 protein [Planctomycetota bacterium]